MNIPSGVIGKEAKPGVMFDHVGALTTWKIRLQNYDDLYPMPREVGIYPHTGRNCYHAINT